MRVCHLPRPCLLSLRCCGPFECLSFDVLFRIPHPRIVCRIAIMNIHTRTPQLQAVMRCCGFRAHSLSLYAVLAAITGQPNRQHSFEYTSRGYAQAMRVKYIASRRRQRRDHDYTACSDCVGVCVCVRSLFADIRTRATTVARTHTHTVGDHKFARVANKYLWNCVENTHTNAIPHSASAQMRISDHTTPVNACK